MIQRTITLADLAAQIAILTQAVLANKSTMNISEAAAYTGLSVSFLYKLTSQQEIPHYKPRGKNLAFDRAELDEWQKQNKICTLQEIDQQASDHLVRR